MKLVTYERTRGELRAGALIDDGTTIVDLAQGQTQTSGTEARHFVSVQAMIEGDDEALAQAYRIVKQAGSSARVARAAAHLKAPVQPPIQMRDCLCFETHLKQAFQAARKLRASQFPNPEAKMAEMEREGILAVPKTFYEQPIYYKPNRFAVIGTDDDVIWPAYSKVLDFELEFGFYIKGQALNVPKAKARDYIYGYTIFNDISARDAQTQEMGGQLGPGKGKDFDTANPMGPCLVTADELTDPYKLTMIARVNGEEWGRGNSNSMYWSFEDLIAHVSRNETLYPGEFFGSGTVGNGCGLEQMRFLNPGDVVELEVEGIGILRNRIVAPKPKS
jgi:2-keto-4-pentenoate hydratase/2-oxohepta-3-ene-1,7-dioic acid hydratase in catechol pathway